MRSPRTLRAQVAGQWLQRLDSGLKTEADFQTEVSAQFGVAPASVTVVVTETTLEEFDAMRAAMGTGLHEGKLVTPAPKAPTPSPIPLDTAITTATTLEALKAALLGKVQPR